MVIIGATLIAVRGVRVTMWVHYYYASSREEGVGRKKGKRSTLRKVYQQENIEWQKISLREGEADKVKNRCNRAVARRQQVFCSFLHRVSFYELSIAAAGFLKPNSVAGRTGRNLWATKTPELFIRITRRRQKVDPRRRKTRRHSSQLNLTKKFLRPCESLCLRITEIPIAVDVGSGGGGVGQPLSSCEI